MPRLHVRGIGARTGQELRRAAADRLHLDDLEAVQEVRSKSLPLWKELEDEQKPDSLVGNYGSHEPDS